MAKTKIQMAKYSQTFYVDGSPFFVAGQSYEVNEETERHVALGYAEVVTGDKSDLSFTPKQVDAKEAAAAEAEADRVEAERVAAEEASLAAERDAELERERVAQEAAAAEAARIEAEKRAS